MLSRRNIRIKVMQLLYAKSRDKQLAFDTLLERYRKTIENSYELFLFHLLQFTKVTQYALHDAAKRTVRLLPTEDDKQFKAKLAENELVQSLIQNEGLYKTYRSYYLEAKIDKDNTRLIYMEYSKTDAYKKYLKQEVNSSKDHLELLLDLYKFCSTHEVFTDVMEDHYTNWIDDKSLIIGTLKKTIKALPLEGSFYEQYIPSAETSKDFGERMLRMVYQEDEEYLAIIEPTLKNWDADRVAVIDMIILKMAICELMSFSSIPTKVTLNEFVEISKLYSTDKSKDFINGILDRLMKKLQKEGKIQKEGRGLKE